MRPAIRLNNWPVGDRPSVGIHSFARRAAGGLSGAVRVAYARALVAELISAFWVAQAKTRGSRRKIRRPPDGLAVIPKEATDAARAFAASLRELPAIEAGHKIGALYTALLPDDVRGRLGAFYTPPALAERLLQMTDGAGVDWRTVRVLDPACGGAAFLAPVAARMRQSLKKNPRVTPVQIVENVGARLRGFEIDPFAAWISQVLVDLILLDDAIAADVGLPRVIEVCDSLARPVSGERFGLVIGNPPYGKVKLTPTIRDKYTRSLFGHANLYALFTDLGLRWVAPSGHLAYVTPTSFLGGQYFKGLRALLSREAPLREIDFVTERSGVFEDVLQETCLALFERGASVGHSASVNSLSPNGADEPVQITKVGKFRLDRAGDPWLLPRTRPIRRALGVGLILPARLRDYGVTVTTGPLVWNRHKPQLTAHSGPNRLPLVWAEAVSPDGEFRFSAVRRNHTPYFRLKADQEHLVVRDEAILVQRTTSLEQPRRLLSALMPKAFVSRHGGVVIENHLNVIRASSRGSHVPLVAIQAVLNSRAADRVFRCISGSVAVSAYELGALPLPSIEDMRRLAALLERGAQHETIERAISRMYGTPDD